MKVTRLLKDDPSHTDEFGPHKKLALLLRNEIRDASEGRSIALVGDWGSGKSTVIELLKQLLLEVQGKVTRLFIYDAWSHQGDSLRRAFLDDLIYSFSDWLTEEQRSKATARIWNRLETTKTETQPVLRNHTKIIFISLLLIPLGMKLFSIPDNTTLRQALFLDHNVASYVLLLTPVLLIFLFALINVFGSTTIKTFLFGQDSNKAGFSVLSFFFSKVEGQVERKYITTPADSIRTFREIFSELLDQIEQAHQDSRIVIVIDNIDRIPADQAREFWSTLQTFFADGGGLRKPKTKKYWLIAPFSIQALSFIFKDTAVGEMAVSAAKSYIEKTFGLAFYVPPPILANWRDYLLHQLQNAFPEHSLSDLTSARDAFDFAHAGDLVTPRQLKLFVNNLVVLYRQKDEDIPLATMALYLLHRDSIKGAEIADDLLTPMEQRLIEGPDWKVSFAALHYDVSTTEATQILLKGPLIAALRQGSSSALEGLSKRHGFVDVLVKQVGQELTDAADTGGILPAKIAVAIGGLPNASSPDFAAIWRIVRERLKNTQNWDGLEDTTAEGIKVALLHCPEEQKASLSQTLASSLAGTNLGDPPGSYDQHFVLAERWLATAFAILNGAPPSSVPKITLAGSPRTKFELLQELAVSPLTPKLKRQFDTGISESDLTAMIAAEILAGRYPRVQYSLVTLLHDVLEMPVEWPQVNPNCAQRLRVAGLGAPETEALLHLLLAVRGITGLPAALATLADLSTSGSLSNLLSLHNGNATTRAVIVAAIILANPSFSRPAQVEQSANGDNILNAIYDGEPDLDLAGAVAQVVTKARLVDQLFGVGADNQKIAKFTSAVFGKLADENVAINLPAELVLEKRQYLLQYPQYNPAEVFIRHLATRSDLLTLAETQKFELERLPFYKAALLSSDGADDAKFRTFLSSAIRKLEQKDWEESLTSQAQPVAQLLPLVAEIKQKDSKFTLPTPARDAALEQVRNVAKGNIVITAELKAAFGSLMSALSKDTAGSLGTDLMDDLCALTDPTQITRLIDFVGEYLDVNNSYEVGRVVRRVFVPLINKPAQNTAVWMAAFVQRKDSLFRSMASFSRNDLAGRLRKALQTEGLDPQISEAFGRVLEHIDPQNE